MSARKKSPAPRPAAKKAPSATRATPVTALGLDEIKGLIALVARESFAEFEFEVGEMRFKIRKDGVAPAPSTHMLGSPVAHVAAQTLPPAPAPAALTPAAAPAAPAEDPNIHYLTSPIVGTFYQASNPNSPSFVNPGDKVKPGQTLCIVEAMKLMNEIECDVAGEVVKVLVENGQPVEYGERLFAIKVG